MENKAYVVRGTNGQNGAFGFSLKVFVGKDADIRAAFFANEQKKIWKYIDVDEADLEIK